MFLKLAGSRSGGKFRAVYRQSCGGMINVDRDGVIVSPNYPSRFPRIARCVWVLYSNYSSRRISLTVTHLDIQTRDNDCNKGYLSFYDGMDENFDVNDTVSTRYCGSSVPATHTSFGSYLTVVFNTGYRARGTGFRAVYSSAQSSCGGVFTAPSGRFTSPRYPDSYPMNADCVWQLNASPGNSLSLNFPTFSLDPYGGFNDDYLEIRSPDANGQLIGRWFGVESPPTNATHLHGVWVKFRSNEENSGQGFVAEWNSVFGGTLTGDSGQLSSPLYPSNYPNNVDYTWTIIASQGRRVQLTLQSLAMEGYTPACPHDYLRITEGMGQSSGVQLARLCGRDAPDTITASGNVVTLRFVTDGSIQASGFLINWNTISGQGPGPTTASSIPGCGGSLVATDTVQNFTSPFYPADHPHNLNCLWNITTDPGSSVLVNITDIDLEGWRTQCYYDYVQFFDGPGGRSPSLGKFCGRLPNSRPLKSRSNLMAVRFTTDGSDTNRGFVVTYQKACGGLLTQPQGSILSPQYPQEYPANSNCTWSVRVRTGKTIRVVFSSTFSLATNNNNCGQDYVELRNGYSANAPPLFRNGSTSNTNGRYCGSSRPRTLTTTDNTLRVTFRSDASVNAVGFSLVYSEVSIACGGSLTVSRSTPGYFMSPGYPGNYNHNMDCIWVLAAPPSQRIRIDFEDPFNIEPVSNCRFDYLEFHDGGTIYSPRIGDRLCGSTRPATIRSTGNILMARFRTDSSAVHEGFKVRYSVDSCGGHITATEGTLTSPNFPSNYPRNALCEWTISAPMGHYINMNFTDIQMERSLNCSKDVVEIRDGNSTSDVLLRVCYRYTSPARQPIETSDNNVYIKFRSDNSNQQRGFRLVFRSSASVCGGTLNTPTGVITSPNYPNMYAHRRICRWYITVPEGRRIRLEFTDFQLERASGYFCYDYVMIFNGIIPLSPRLMRACSSGIPDPVESSGNTMMVYFRTDGSVSARGFRATYSSNGEAECGGLRTTAPGNLTSPGYENGNHSHNIQCVWRLQNPARSNSSVQLWFVNLELEYHMNCLYDFLEIREGQSNTAPFVDRYCGNRTTNAVRRRTIVLPSSDVWLRFRTDMSVTSGGFQLLYNFTACGGIIQGDTPGYLTSPNFPNNYDHNDACAWRITAPEGSRIRIQFLNFTMEAHSTCNYDFLEIYNGGQYDSPVTGKYCGSTMPSDFLSQSNEVRVVMVTDVSASASGFKLRYSIDSSACGGNLDANTGTLSSPNYPRSYPNSEFCEWNIKVSNGYRVQLNFDPVFDLQINSSAICDSDYVEAFDKYANGTRVSLGRWCANVAPPPLTSISRQLVVVFSSDSIVNGHGFTANWTALCGGMFTADRGSIYSPNYPGNYPNFANCSYTIAPAGNKHIRLSFREFQLENHRQCRFDNVTVYAGSNATGRRLGLYCGSRPDVVTAIGSMFIQFKTDHSATARGFAINYLSEECGGNRTGRFGRIRSTLHPYQYNHNANCSWVITVTPGRIILLRFSADFDIEAHPNCDFDYLAVYDGPDSSSALMGRFCGRGENLPGTIMSTGNQLYVNFVSDASQNGRGFRAFYSESYGPVQGCGGVIRQPTGTLTSFDANGDGNYENGLQCQWLIYAQDNKVVTLNVTSLDIENHPTCRFDYLKMYDGTTDTAPLIGSLCGNRTGFHMSSSNVMLVVFSTDSSVVRTGFNATMGQEDLRCGGAYNVTTTLQTLSSPNYPQNTGQQFYRCSWFLDAGSPTQRVRVQLTNLQLMDSTCNNEYLYVKDDALTNGEEKHFCGNRSVRAFNSNGPRVQIIYHMTSTTGGGRFQLSYQVGDCNRNETDNSGRLTSPNYPNNYPTNVMCTTRVNATQGYKLAFYFFQLYIEPHSACRYDYLRISNGTNAEVNTLCGSAAPAPVFLDSNTAILTFRTDSSLQHPGYQITYVASPQESGCGGELRELSEGVFTSPGYPGNNTNSQNSSCQWTIYPARRQTLHYYLSIRGSVPLAQCRTNYVLIMVLSAGRWRNRGRYCRGTSRIVYQSTPIRVNYVTTGVGMGPVFEMKFSNNYSRVIPLQRIRRG